MRYHICRWLGCKNIYSNINITNKHCLMDKNSNEKKTNLLTYIIPFQAVNIQQTPKPVVNVNVRTITVDK